MDGIVSLKRLSSILGKSPARLKEIAAELDVDSKSHYREFMQRSKKNPSKYRKITEPKPELKEIQCRLHTQLRKIELSELVHGGVRGKSPRSNAAQHLGQRWVVNVDVKDFYPSVSNTEVHRMFRRLGWGSDVARLVTRLTTLDGGVPQGAPTSTAVANLVLASIDNRLPAEAKNFDARNSRFVDDYTFSGPNPTPLIQFVGRGLAAHGLTIYRKNAKFQSKPKLRITPASQRQEVTGLVVNCKRGPSVSRTYRDNVKAAIFSLRGVSSPIALREAINSINGKIAHVRQFNPGSAKRLQRSMAKVCNPTCTRTREEPTPQIQTAR
jgi:RNA-directed DNA polymerase